MLCQMVRLPACTDTGAILPDRVCETSHERLKIPRLSAGLAVFLRGLIFLKIGSFEKVLVCQSLLCSVCRRHFRIPCGDGPTAGRRRSSRNRADDERATRLRFLGLATCGRTDSAGTRGRGWGYSRAAPPNVPLACSLPLRHSAPRWPLVASNRCARQHPAPVSSSPRRPDATSARS
jgi:hypothetical protein